MYTVYSKPNCPYCVKAKTLLDIKELEYQVIDVMQDAEAMNLMRTNGFRSVPQIYEDDKHIGGFDALEKYLNQ